MSKFSMKYIPIILGLATILWSCVSDRFDEPSSTTTEAAWQNLPGFMTVRMVTNAQSNTRADDETSTPDGFKDGEDSEYAVAPEGQGINHFLILFPSGATANSNALAILRLTKYSDDKATQTADDAISLNITAVYNAKELDESLTTTEAVKNYLSGKECYAILNSPFTEENLKSKSNSSQLITLKELKEMKVTEYSVKGSNDGKEYFTMSNSVYLDANNKIISGRTITSGGAANIYETKQQAAAGNPIVTINVDRLAAKFSLNYQGQEIDEDMEFNLPQVKVYVRLNTEGSGYEIVSQPCNAKMKVLGFGINGLEKTSFLYKNILTSNNNIPTVTTFYPNWNSIIDNRSYWAVDQNYSIVSSTKNQYPQQYRVALETDTVNAYVQEKNYVLKYQPFTSFLDNMKVYYSLENTFDASSKDWKWTRAALTAGSHAIITCQLEIEWPADGNQSAGYQIKDLFYSQNGIFYSDETTFLTAKLELLNRVILPGGTSGIRVLNADWLGEIPKQEGETDFVDKIHWDMGALLWIRDNDGAKVRRLEMSDNYKDLKFIKANISGGDGKLMIAPSNPDAKFYLATEEDVNNPAINLDGGSRELGTDYRISYNELVSLFHKLIGDARHFTKGYMYYAAPITHNTKNIIDKQGEDYDSWYKVGDIGVVRNNWYGINVKSFNNIGIPIDDPDQPIVPPLEAMRDYMNVTMEVLKWHEITENVKFIPW